MTALDLVQRLKQHSQSIDRLLATVAPKYLVQTQDKGEHYNRYLKNQSKDPEHKQHKKEMMKEAKRFKLDPESKRTLKDVQEQVKNKAATTEDADEAREDEGDDDEDDEMDVDEEIDNDSDVEDDDGAEEEDGDDASGSMGMDVDEDLQVDDMRPDHDGLKLPESKMSNDKSELRKRLHDKINGMRNKRKADMDDARPKKKRKVEKLSKADKKKARKVKSKDDRKQVQAKGVALATSRAELDHRDCVNKPQVVKEDGQMVFSKFDFADGKGKQKKKDYKHLLLKAESNIEKLKTLQQEDSAKAKEVGNKKAFNRAMEMAEGKKQLDNPTLLRKAIKRQEKKKAKSASEWGERLNSAKTAVKKAQDTRDANLKKRSEVKKNKKINGRGKKTSEETTKKKKQKAGPGFK